MDKKSSTIHPELQRAAKKIPTISVSSKNLWFINALMPLLRAPKAPEDILAENVLIPHPDNRTTTRLRIYKPKSISTPVPVLLWLHGGGYIMGKPEMDEQNCIEYVREAGIVVVSVDYRCAPKYPFPTALEDSYLALKWVVARSEQLNVDPNRIAIGGASAGAGLAAALVQCAYDRQEIKPVFQLLIYPMLDDRTVLRTDINDGDYLVWTPKSNRFGWESYLGTKCGADNAAAYSVPARREDLSGLPPAWIGVGELDLFYDEDMAYAKRLKECGVECEMSILPGVFHGFDAVASQAPIVREFRNSQLAALRKYLFP